MAEMGVPSQLKFLMGNIKSIMNTQLIANNYPLWHSQILKLFTTNGFDGFLDGTTIKPPKQIAGDNGNITPNPLQYVASCGSKLYDSIILNHFF